MRGALLIFAVFFGESLLLRADAAQPAAAVCTRVADGLREEVALLDSIQNGTTARQVLPALDRLLNSLAALREDTDEEVLRRYIENTPGMKKKLTVQIELLIGRLQRLRKARFFGNQRLEQLLSTQIKTDA